MLNPPLAAIAGVRIRLMAYDEGLAFRLRELLSERRDVVEKEMFGGLAFLLAGSMSVGVVGEDLLVRVGPERHEVALARPHARIMDFTGRPMKGWIFVGPAGLEEDTALASWVDWGVETAGRASSTKSKPAARKRATKTPSRAVAKKGSKRKSARRFPDK